MKQLTLNFQPGTEPTGEMTTSSSPVGSLNLANHSATPENETEQAMIATSGRKCYESLERLGQPGSLARTLLASCRWTAGLYSKKYALRWRLKGTPSKRLYCQLFPVERRTEEIGFGLLLTPGVVMHEEHPEDYKARTEEKGYNRNNEWTSLAAQIAYMDLLPTPKSQNANSPGEHGQGGKDLQTTVSNLGLLGTPTSRDWKDTGDMTNVPENGLLGRQVANISTNGANTGMKLQPAFALYMMGYPENWCDLDK